MTSDQIPDVPRILIAVLTTYERSGWPHKKLAEFLESLRTNMSYATAVTFAHNFIPAAGARNFVGRQLKDCGADWICMIDNDMSPPFNMLDTVRDAPADAAVIVPRFHLWDEDAGLIKLCWGMEDKQVEALGYRIEEKFYELTKCGTGAIFIKPEVFQKVPPPWFWYTYDQDMGITSTEDINFAIKVREHGFKIYGNGKITVGHHHTVDLSVLARLLQQARPHDYGAPAEKAGQGLDNSEIAGSDLARSQDPSESPSTSPVLAAVSPTQ